MHGTCSMHVPKRTSLGPPSRVMERPPTAAAAALAHSVTPNVKPWPLAATAASAWPPVRVGVGS